MSERADVISRGRTNSLRDHVELSFIEARLGEMAYFCRASLRRGPLADYIDDLECHHNLAGLIDDLDE
jgi:hypothetical protein